MMTNVPNITYKTPLARWLFENDLCLRDAAKLFASNRTTMMKVTKGQQVPRGLTRELISKVLLGEITLPELHKQSELRRSSGSPCPETTRGKGRGRAHNRADAQTRVAGATVRAQPAASFLEGI